MTDGRKRTVLRLSKANELHIENHKKIAYMCDCGTVIGDLFAHFRTYHPNDQPQVQNVKIRNKKADNLKVNL